MIYKCLLGLIFASLLDKGDAEIYAIKFNSQFYREEFADKPALFGPSLKDRALAGMLMEANPPGACRVIASPPPIDNPVGKWIVLVRRLSKDQDDGNCSFEQKVRISQAARFDAVIVYNVDSDELVPMGANNKTGIEIPSVFISEKSGIELLNKYANNPDFFVVINGDAPFDIPTHLLVPFAIVVGICFIVMIVFMVWKFLKDRRRQRRYRLPKAVLNKIPIHKFQKGDPFETCAICIDDYVDGEKLRVLPCNHAYHAKCVDPWLTKNKRVCPICKRSIWGINETRSDSDSETDTDDTTPLINNRSSSGTQGGTFQQQFENPFQRAIRSVSQTSGAATANFVTTSGHHSINGDYQSARSSSGSYDDCSNSVISEDVMNSTNSGNPFEESTSSGRAGDFNVKVNVVQVDTVSTNSSVDGGAHA